jgi:hypothetical protein
VYLVRKAWRSIHSLEKALCSVKYALRIWRDPLQKNSSIYTVSTDESFKDGQDTERPAKSASHLQGFGGGVLVCRSTTGGEEGSPRGSAGTSDATFSSTSLAFTSPFLGFFLLPFALRASFSFFLSWRSLSFLFFSLILLLSFSGRTDRSSSCSLFFYPS